MSNEDIIHIMNDKIERLEEENTQLKVALRSLYCIDSADPRDVILGILASNGGDLVEYDALVGACISAGSSREEAEDTIENLKDVSMEISEPRFGFFSVSS